MNVLSLFDGISCGQLALRRAGVSVYNYFSSEINKYAIEITQRHFPNTVQLGSVENWAYWKLPKIDLILAGSPCQGFSSMNIKGKKGLKHNESKLFWDFINILSFYKPNHFLLENVKMKNLWRDLVTKVLERVCKKKMKPVSFDSALLSAQKRKRLYWSSIKYELPKDKGLVLKDINPQLIDITEEHKRKIEKWGNYYSDRTNALLKDSSLNNKTKCVFSVYGKIETQPALIKKLHKFYKLSIEDWEKLQTLPVGYTKGVPMSHRSHLIGNGWTVDVIAYILRHMR